MLYDKLKKNRKYVLFFIDVVLWSTSFYITYCIIRETFVLKGFEREFLWSLLILNIVFTIVFFAFKLYDNIWRYAEVEEFFYIALATLVANFAFFMVTGLLGLRLGGRTYIFTTVMSAFALFLFRLLYRFNTILEERSYGRAGAKKRLLIVGGGRAATILLKELAQNARSEYTPIGIVDDDQEKIGRKIVGVKVLGTTYELMELCEKYNIETIIVSIVKLEKEDKKRILDTCAKTGREVSLIPDIYELMTTDSSFLPSIKPVEVEDLLGRDPVELDIEQIGEYIIGKKIMVTGAGGSIGSELCRQLISLSPSKLILLDIYENNVYEVQQELLMMNIEPETVCVEIASIRDKSRMDCILEKHHPHVIFHAAAHKHVPLMEENIEEAVKNNIGGALCLAQLACDYKAERFVLISTDKAVNPTNIMGATKRICEIIVQAMNEQCVNTVFTAVRFGNVLGSSGSVIPLFKNQLKNGGPITVTHPEIVRYFMTIPEAVALVITAGSMADGGEIFVLDMGEPVKIRDLAENLIRLSGLVPDKDIKITYTGLRPGEKLYEELLLAEEGIESTNNKKIFIGHSLTYNSEKLSEDIENLLLAAEENDTDKILRLIKQLVPNFSRNSQQ